MWVVMSQFSAVFRSNVFRKIGSNPAMFSLGHTAGGTLFGGLLGSGKKLDPTSLACLFLFANALDVAHWRGLRTATHSLLFFALFIPLLVWFAERRGWLRPRERLMMLMAAASHILCDAMFGGFAFWYPVDPTAYRIFAWGSYFNYAVETLLFLLMLVLLGWQRPWRQAPRTRRFHRVVFAAMAFIGFVQIAVLLYNDFFRGPNFYDGTIYNDGSRLWMSVLFITAQAAFIGLMAVLLIKTGRQPLAVRED